MIVAELIENLRKLPQDEELLAKSAHHKIILFGRDHAADPVLQMDMILLGVTPTDSEA